MTPASSTRPTFVRVLTHEVGLYGWAGAGVVAHIRYRCAAAGADRIERGGRIYWLASLTQIAYETSSTSSAIRSALRSAAAGLDVLRKPCTPDQRSAYHALEPDVSELPFVESGTVVEELRVEDALQVPDQPFVQCDTVPEVIHNRAKSSTVPCQIQHGAVSDLTNAPLYEKERRGEGASAADREPLPVGNVPDPDDAPPRNLRLVGHPPAPARPAAGGPEPPACRRHPHGTDAPCRGCQAVREYAEAAAVRADADRAEAAEVDRRREAACSRCDSAGWLLDNDGAPVEPARRCTHEVAS